MRNVFLKTLCILLLCISNGFLYAWENNPATSDWNWNYKEDPIINAPSSCQTHAQTNWTPTITVYACSTLGSLSGATAVGTGYFSDNYTKIHTTINRYLPDKYYVVAIPWRDASKIVVTNYIICNKTQEDAFNVTLNKTISRSCESNFYASVSASVTGGSDDYTVTWSATNGNWHQAAQYSGYVEASDFADRTKSKTIKVVIRDNVWGTDLTRSAIFKGVKFSVNTFLGLVYGGTGWSVLGTNEGGGNGTKTFTWSKSFYPTYGYSNLTNGSDGYLCSLGSLQFNDPANTTFFKQYVTQSDCGQSGYTTTSNGTSYYMHTVPIANVSATAGGATSTTIGYGGSVALSCTSTGGRVDKTYTWYKCSTSNGNYTTTGATGASYSPSGLTSTTYYKCLVSDPENTSGIWSNVVTVTVRPALSIGTISRSASEASSGTNVTLSITASGGTGSYSYQWKESTNNSTWTNISGGSTCTVSGSGVTKYYKVVVTSDGQTKEATSVSVKWRTALSASISGGGVTTYSGGSMTLTANPSGGDGNYTYQWQFSQNGTSWTTTLNATNKTFSVYCSNNQFTTKTYYRVIVNSDGQTLTTDYVTITWRPVLFAGTINGGNSETYSGGSVTLTANPSGGNNSYTYQWYYSDNNSTWIKISGATGKTYSASATNSGASIIHKYYHVVVKGDNQTKTSGSVTVSYRPALVAGGVSGGGQTTYSGGSVTLTANPSGGNSSYTYQWEVSDNNSSWSNISGATSKTYAASATNSGSSNITKYYRVTVGGDGQSKTSDAVTIIYRPALVAGSIGGATTTYNGGSVTLTANPSGGNGSYTYQWQYSDNNSTWNNISGATSKTYSTSNTNSGSSNITKYYRVTIGGDSQSKTSTSVSVAWRPALVAGSISGATTTNSGGSVTLTANPSGGNSTYTYQWEESADGSAWSNITSNGTGKTYTVSKANSSSSNLKRYYRVKVTGDNQSGYASAVTVTWRPSLVAGAITGGNVTTYSGGSVTLTANPSGGTGSGYSYQWKQSADGINWSSMAGETNKTCVVVGTEQTLHYKVVVSGDNQTKESNPVSVTWGSALSAGGITGTTNTYSGGTITLTANPSGGQSGITYSYQWQIKENSTWNDISGKTGRTYSVSNNNPGNSNLTKTFRVKVTGDNQTAYSADVTAIWRPALVAGSVSGGGAYNYGANATLTANPAGGDYHNYTYQWQESGNNSSWNNISGASGKSYSVVGYNQTKYYRVVVSGDNQTKESQSVSVTWRSELMAGSITGGGVTTYNTGSVTLTANPSGGNDSYTYQWQESATGSSWNNISGGIGKTCSVSSANPETSNLVKYYRVVVTGDNQTKESSSVTITYRPALVAGAISGATTTYSGGTVTLSANPSGGTGSGYSYQWEQSTNNANWSDVTNANGKSCTVNGSNQTIYYRVKVTGDNQIAYAASVSVTWRPALVAGAISGATTTYSGDAVTLSANPSGGNGSFTYQWQVSDNNSSWSNISGATNQFYDVSNTNSGNSNITKYYRVVVAGDNQNATSSAVSVSWRPALVAGSISGGGVETYNGGSVTLTANPSGGNGSFTYQWQESTDNTNWSNISSDGGYKSFAVNCTNFGNTKLTKYYRAIVTGDNQIKESQSVIVTYRPALMAVINNGDVSTHSGGNVALSVSSSGGDGENYSYQWEQSVDDINWSNVINANSMSCSVSGSNQSIHYRVKVTGDNQVIYTASVMVSWRPALVVGAVSGATTTYSGNNVTLSVVPTGGNGEFTYQWQVSENNSDWNDIDGADFNSLVETGDNETDAPITMYYRVVVSSDDQIDTSDIAAITRRPSLKIGSIQPIGNSIVYGGDDVNLTVDAIGGDGTYSYQWYRRDIYSDWMAVGSNSASFTDNHDNNTDAAISYQYKVVVSGDSQEKTSAEFQCSWVAFMSIRSMMYAGEKLSYGTNTSISIIMANGSGIYDYQWQTLVNGEWQNIPDNDNPVYTFAITEAGDYRCVVTDSLYPTKSVTSDVASLDVWPDLIPGTTPATSYTVDNDSITIGGGTPSGGNGTYHYRWEKRTGNGEFVPMPDTTPTIDVLPDCNTTYRRYDISGDQEKLAFEIQVNVPLKSGAIGVDGLAEFYYAGQQLPMLENKTEASGGNVGGTASYQWYWRKEGSSGFEPIEGATEADYQPSGLPVTTSFYRAIVDGDDVQNSNVIELVIRVPEILVSNLKQRYCKGDRVGINASGVENGVYKWFDASGKQIGSGSELSLNSIDESATLTLKTFLGDDELLNEKDVALTVVDMTPDFASDRIIVDAGDVVHFSNNGTDYAQCEWDFGDGADGSFESEPWHYYNYGGIFDVKLRLTSSEGCQVEITKAGVITVNEAVSTDIEADWAGSVSIYPNPATDWLTVEADGEFVVTITNNLGSVVFKSTASTNLRIDITNYPEGIYTVGVVDGAGNAHFEQIVKY